MFTKQLSEDIYINRLKTILLRALIKVVIEEQRNHLSWTKLRKIAPQLRRHSRYYNSKDLRLVFRGKTSFGCWKQTTLNPLSMNTTAKFPQKCCKLSSPNSRVRMWLVEWIKGSFLIESIKGCHKRLNFKCCLTWVDNNIKADRVISWFIR